MMLTNIALTNWMSHIGQRSFDLARMTIVAGPNGSGKSALRDAVSFALLADLGRVPTRGDRPALVSEGTDAGSVKVAFDGTERTMIGRNVADGKLTTPGKLPLADDAITEAVPYVLDRKRFAQDGADERRKLLAKLMRTEMGPDAILAALQERGHPPLMIAELRAAKGPDEWIKHCETRATEARGAWKALTGTTYGPEKAKNYEVPAPSSTGTEEVLAAEKAMRAAQSEVGDLHRELGRLDAATENGQRQAQRYALVKGLADSEPATRAALAHADLALTEAVAQRGKDAMRLADMKANLPRETLSCPECGCLVGLAGNADGTKSMLVKADEPTQPDDSVTMEQIAKASAELTAFDATVRSLSAARRSAAAELERATAAKEEFDRMLPPAEPAIGPNARETLQERLTSARSTLDARTENLRALREAAAKAKDASDRTAKAAAEHQAVAAWTAIKEALAPDGIPGQVMNRALEPFNDLLREMAGETAWRQVAIRPDMAIVVGGRPYFLLSESERWRADVVLTVAVAMLTELRFVLIDEFDLLDVPSRTRALGWFYGLTKQDDLDTVLLLATMKAPPQVPAAVRVHWLGGTDAEARAA